MSDCSECWDTPCTCGYAYKHYATIQLAMLIAGMLRYRSQSEANNILELAMEQVKHSKDWVE